MKKAALTLSIIALSISVLNLVLSIVALLDKKNYLNVDTTC